MLPVVGCFGDMADLVGLRTVESDDQNCLKNRKLNVSLQFSRDRLLASCFSYLHSSDRNSIATKTFSILKSISNLFNVCSEGDGRTLTCMYIN